MRRLFRILLSFVLVTAALAALPALTSQFEAAAATITVDGDCTYDDLADAIDGAATGDIIEFDCDDSTIGYEDNGHIEIDKELTIDGGGTITLDAENNSRHFTLTSDGDLTLENIELVNGTAGASIGGAILNSGGAISIVNSTFSGNSANAGGAIHNGGGTITVSGSTFFGNSAHFGGAIHNNSSTLAVTNSTFSGNSAISDGGAIHNSSSLTITNSTFSGNSADDGGAIYLFESSGNVTASVLASNGENCAASSPSDVFESGGYNLTDDTSCGFDSEGDNVVIDAHLGELADNGGFTETMLPGLDSAAVNAIPADKCAVDTDQRGVERPQVELCDIGAVEVNADLFDQQAICANRYNGNLRMPRSNTCASTETLFELPADGPLDVCTNRYNGDVRYSRTGTCASTETLIELTGAATQSICVNRYNGDVRVPRVEGQCASTETARVL